MDTFVNLHLHSTFSFIDGLGLPNQYAKRAKELGQIAIGVSDHGNVSSHFKWYKSCIKEGIKPILGCELYIQKKIDDTEKYHHLTVLALNNEGYLNLLKIVSEGWKKLVWGKPAVLMQFVLNNQKGLLITSGCPSGRICKLIGKNKIKEAKEQLLTMKELIDNFYIEISPWTFENGKKLIPYLYDFSNQLDIPMLATNDCHYVKKEQSHIQETLLCIQSNDRMDNPKRWKFDQNDFHLKTRKEMEESFVIAAPNIDFTQALDNTVKIAEMVDFEFPKASPLKFPIPDEEKKIMFHQLCIKGIEERKLIDKKEYIERMEYEFDLIVKKNYIDYFLIVQDIVCWAKNNGILVGPARGSAAGSLICYLLRITEVDPLKFGLIFERFIDINREDLPDIDIDFEDERRPDIKHYIENKYGIDKVAALATYSTFKGKQIINDLGRIHRMPFDVITRLKSIIIERSGGDSRASFTIEDTFNQFEIAKEYLKQYPFLSDAKELEGQLRNMSTHASGIIVSNEPLLNFSALYVQKEDRTVSLDYYDASEMGLVKIDILGLNTLTAISKTLKLIKERHNIDINLYNLDLEDEKVYEGFKNAHKLFGIFQFDGQAVNQVCRQMMPDNFGELTAINALSRPGPMHGIDLETNQPITSMYILRKHKKAPKKTAHHLLDKITDDTQGLIIYQEQVMKVMREIGKMNWKDTAEIRKNISKSRGVEAFNEYKAKFSIGARENGLTQFEIDNIWSAVCSHGSWSFNLSHSVSYSIISYWCIAASQKIFDPNKGKWIAISKAFKNNLQKTLCLMENGDVKIAPIKKILRTGKKEVWRMNLSWRNQGITATKKHLFWTKKGWIKMQDIKIGDEVLMVANHKFEKTRWVKVKSIKKMGIKMTYDIAMDIENGACQNYITNGIVSHNTMFLKVYYPIEYYSAMTSTMNNEDRIRRVIKEYIREGNVLLPIDVNLSKESFSIDNNQLRLGLSQVRGIGEKAAQIIVKNQPYKNIENFEKRSGLGKSKIEILSKLKAFQSIGGVSKDVNTLFGTKKETKYNESITIEETIKLCPLAVDFNISEKWGEFVKQNIVFPISKIENLDASMNSQTIYGIIYDKNLKDTVEEALSHGRPVPQLKNGLSKYCNFIIEDDQDFTTVRVSTHSFDKFKRAIFEESNEGDIILVQGKQGDGIRMFFCNQLVNLNRLKEKIDRKATIDEYTNSELYLTGKIKLPRYGY